MAKYNKEEYIKEKNKQIKDLQSKIEETTSNFIENPEEYVEFLKFSLQFYNYSTRNIMLIQKQNPLAHYVGSYKHFKDLGYNVKKGEKGMKILVPAPSKTYIIDGELKRASDLTVEDKKKIEKEKIEPSTTMHYKIGTVFSIGQTNMPDEDIPEFFKLGNSGINVDDKIFLIEKYLENKKINLYYNDLDLGTYGFYVKELNEIQVHEKLKDENKLSTLIHETGHSLLHNKDQRIKTTIQELQADTVDLMMFEYFNLPLPDKRIRHLKYNLKELTKEEVSKNLLPVINEMQHFIKDIEEIKETSLEYRRFFNSKEIEERDTDNDGVRDLADADYLDQKVETYADLDNREKKHHKEEEKKKDKERTR